jgi:hypothetical protein
VVDRFTIYLKTEGFIAKWPSKRGEEKPRVLPAARPPGATRSPGSAERAAKGAGFNISDVGWTWFLQSSTFIK